MSREGSTLSSSPIAIPGPPILQRNTGESDVGSRARHSPSLVRPFDPDDIHGVERQRTMDVDMAMQLSLARRETLSSPIIDTHDATLLENRDNEYGMSLSPNEQRVIDIARRGDIESGNGTPVAATPRRSTSLLDLRGHIHGLQDPSLLAPSPAHMRLHDSLLQLPKYQANNASQSSFDFTPMEEFATQERAARVPGPPVTRFSLSALRRAQTSITRHEDRPTYIQPSPPHFPDASEDALIESETVPRPARNRRLSQSQTPRKHRKGIGRKMALFEGHTEPGSFSNRLNTILGGQNVSSDQVNDSGAPDGAGGLAGILNTGHDRPYRFSFYSNALSATIHAKSLSELPAEGQSFEDLFSGVNPVTPGAGGNVKHTKDRPVPGTGDAKGSSDQTHKLGAQKSTSAVSTVPADSDVTTWWLDIQNPTEEEMKMLGKVFSIHPLTTEDILMEETREKIELFRNYYLVCFRSFDQDLYSPTHLEPLNMYIIVFREGTLSFHFRSTPHPQNVRRRIKQLKDYISVTSDWISYALIDDITDAFGPLIQSIEYEVDSIDELVLILKETTEQSDMLRRIGTCRKKVMGLLRLMGNKADVVKGLAKRCNENWRVAPTSDIGLYLSDIQDHLITMTQNLNHYEKILSRSHSNYLAQISIEMTDANNQINDVLSKLTALGTILIPMNLVTGLWGMNVHVPGQDITEGYVWFGAIIAALVAFAIIGGYSTYKFMVNR